MNATKITKLLGLAACLYFVRCSLVPRPEHVRLDEGDKIGDLYIHHTPLTRFTQQYADLLLIPFLLHALFIYTHPRHWSIPGFLQLSPSAYDSAWSIGDVVGVVVSYTGYRIRQAAFDELGHLFTYIVKIKSDHQLIKTGPYTYLMHPSYTGALLAVAGCMLFIGFRTIRFWILIALPQVLAVFVPRIVNEERVLRDQFGAEFDAYKASRWRLFPFIL